MRKILFLTVLMIGLSSAGQAFSVCIEGPNDPRLAFDPEMNRYLVVYWNVGSPDEGCLTAVTGKFIEPDGTEGEPFDISMGDPEGTDYRDVHVAFDPINRRFLVVWMRWYFPGGTEYDIYGQLINQDGTFLGENLVINSADEYQRYPKVAFDEESQRYLVVFTEEFDPTNWEIYGQIVDKDGVLAGSAFNISDSVGSDNYPFVASAGQGKFMAGGMNAMNLDAKIIESDGDIGSSYAIHSLHKANEQAWIAYDGHNSLLAVWEDSRSGFYDIYAEKIEIDSYTESNIPVCTNASVDSYMPSVAYDSINERYFAVWMDTRNDAGAKIGIKTAMPAASINTDIFGTYISSDGQVEDSFAVYEDSYYQEPPDVSFNSNCANFMTVFITELTDVLTTRLDLRIIGEECSDPPTAPELIAPQNDEQEVSVDPTFSWNKSSDPDSENVSYSVLYCKNENFEGCSSEQVSQTKMHAKNNKIAGIGFWVIAMAAGLLISFKDKRKYLLSFILMSITIAFATTGIRCSSSDTISFKVHGLEGGTKYYWKVIANDGEGGITHSEKWSFTTE